MKLNKVILSSAATAGFVFLSTSAFAQEATVAVEAEAEVEAEEVAEEEAEVAEAETEVAAEEEAVAEEEAEVAQVEEEAAEPAPAEEHVSHDDHVIEEDVKKEEVEESTGTPSLFVFADAWAGIQTAKSGAGAGGGVYANNGPTGTPESGFGLNWLGADLGYDGGKWALTGSLRFGDAVAIYGTGTLGPVTQAYVTYRPVDGLSLDLGTFGTIYGAEVAESWANLNYTRGELYFNMQPFWHTGLRAEYATGDFVVRGLFVNDANTSNLGTGALNAGLQVGYDDGEMFALYAGALQSLAPTTTVNNGGFVDTFVDVVATASFGDLSIVANFDANVGYEAAGFWGASLAAGYQFTPAFAIAARGEYLASGDGFLHGTLGEDENLVTGTLTLDTKPVPGVDNFVVRWDNRVEGASHRIFTTGTDPKPTWFSSTIGVVGYADLL